MEASESEQSPVPPAAAVDTRSSHTDPCSGVVVADTEEALTTLGEQPPEETLSNLPTDLTLSNLPAESLNTVACMPPDYEA